jgi:hypothetical protein
MLSESDNQFYAIKKSIIRESDTQLVIDGFHMGMFEPVSLSEDVLKRIRGAVVHIDKTHQRKVFKCKQLSFILGKDDVQVQIVNIPVAVCHSLHELQNIYTSLTGEDLTVNL